MADPEKNRDSITVRKARPDDAKIAAQLVYDSGPAIYRNMLGRDENLAKGMLERIFPQPDSLICFSNTLIAESNGEVVGLQINYTAGQEKPQGKRFLYHVYKGLPFFRFLAAFIFMLTMAVIEKKIGKQSLYGAVISVDSTFRGTGVGRALMDHTMDMARANGHTLFEADVETDNENAIRIYRKYGYEFTGSTGTGILSGFLGFKGHYRIQYRL